MKKQFAVIGIGNFGHYLATHLYSKEYEVMAIDKNAGRIQDIKNQVSQAVVADACDLNTLQALNLNEMDTVVVSTGTIISNSILITLNLKDIGVDRVLVKAISEPHGRILNKIGATEIFFPEKDQAILLAERLHNPNMLDYLPFIEGYTIIKLIAKPSFIGKNLRELDLINKYGVQILAIKEQSSKKLNVIPTGHFKLKQDDTLFLIGRTESLDKLRNEK